MANETVNDESNSNNSIAQETMPEEDTSSLSASFLKRKHSREDLKRFLDASLSGIQSDDDNANSVGKRSRSDTFLQSGEDYQENEEDQIDPEQAAFNERLSTFQPLLWSSFNPVTPLECSRYGWKLSSVDLLKCTTCGSVLYGKLAPSSDPIVFQKSVQSLRSKLLSAHARFCKWARLPCPESFFDLKFPSSQIARNKLHDSVIAMVIGYSDVLPRFTPRTQSVVANLSIISSIEAKIRAMQDSADGECVRSAIVLALTGWVIEGNKQVPLLCCKICNRKSGAWIFQSIQDKESEFVEEIFPDPHEIAAVDFIQKLAETELQNAIEEGIEEFREEERQKIVNANQRNSEQEHLYQSEQSHHQELLECSQSKSDDLVLQLNEDDESSVDNSITAEVISSRGAFSHEPTGEDSSKSNNQEEKETEVKEHIFTEPAIIPPQSQRLDVQKETGSLSRVQPNFFSGITPHEVFHPERIDASEEESRLDETDTNDIDEEEANEADDERDEAEERNRLDGQISCSSTATLVIDESVEEKRDRNSEDEEEEEEETKRDENIEESGRQSEPEDAEQFEEEQSEIEEEGEEEEEQEEEESVHSDADTKEGSSDIIEILSSDEDGDDNKAKSSGNPSGESENEENSLEQANESVKVIDKDGANFPNLDGQYDVAGLDSRPKKPFFNPIETHLKWCPWLRISQDSPGWARHVQVIKEAIQQESGKDSSNASLLSFAENKKVSPDESLHKVRKLLDS